MAVVIAAVPPWVLASCAAAVVLGTGWVGVRGVWRERGNPWRWRWLLVPQVGVLICAVVLAYAGWFSGGVLSSILIPGADKVLHFFMFGLLSLWTHFAVRGRTVGSRLRLPIAIVVPFAAAVLEEGAQAWSPHRTADPLDLACDAAGMLLFWCIGVWLTHGAVDEAAHRDRSTV